MAVVAPDGAVRTLATPEEIAKFTKSAAGIRALMSGLPDIARPVHGLRKPTRVRGTNVAREVEAVGASL